MSTAEVDISAERAASRARRDRDHQDTSARVLLRVAALGGYLGGLEEWCDHQHPHWTPEQRAALVARARDLQAEESAAHTLSPEQVMRLHPAARLPSDDVLCNPVERDALDARLSTRSREPKPAAPAATEEHMPKAAEKKPATEDVRRVIKGVLERNPDARFTDAEQAIQERYPDAFSSGSCHYQWKRVRAELGLDSKEESSHGAVAEVDAVPSPPLTRLPAPRPVDPVDPVPAEPAAEEEAAQTPTDNPDTASPDLLRAEVRSATAPIAVPEEVLQENRSLRALYEAGDFVRIEEEGGEWRVQVNLSFDHRVDAMAAVAALCGALE